jgi:hypothetical protein
MSAGGSHSNLQVTRLLVWPGSLGNEAALQCVLKIYTAGVENLKMRTVAGGRSLIAYTRKKKQAINFLTQDYELFARKRLIRISK